VPTRRRWQRPRLYEFIDAISPPDKGKVGRRKREMLRWYGRPYDPEENRIEAELARRDYRTRRRRPPTHGRNLPRPLPDGYEEVLPGVTERALDLALVFGQ
jgi:hypothetical protein